MVQRGWRSRVRAAHRLYTVVVFVILGALDHVAIGLVPPLYTSIGRSLRVSEGLIALATSINYLLTAVVAVGWAYLGDRANRKALLMIGTLLWAAGTGGSALATSYPPYLLAQVVAAFGLGAVGSVGFSVVSDLISPRRRGLVMSLYGLSLGVGTLAGTLLGSVLGASDWRRPFALLSGVGVAASVAYLFTYTIRRGQSEPELAGLFADGGEYRHRIGPRDLPDILGRRSNIWLVLQGLTAQATFGSLVWLPRLLEAKAEAQGYPLDTATKVGGMFTTLFSLGGVLSIVGGLVGDRLQRRTPRGRALVAAAGILLGIPFYVTLFFMPLHLHLSRDAGTGSVAGAVLHSVVTDPTVAVSFLAALLALALTSANSPNWFALLADVNPPEHRGTVYSMGNLANGIGRSSGNAMVGAVFPALANALPPPLNYATGLAIFQVFFVPTGLMYYQASRTVPTDIRTVHTLLQQRARTDRRAPGEDGAADHAEPTPRRVTPPRP